MYAITQNGQEKCTAEDDTAQGTPGVGSARAPPSGVASAESSPNGLGQYGDPAAPEERRVKEEPQTDAPTAQEENENGAPAKLVRAPRSPSQSERELHEATHLPHAEWCAYL